MSTRIVIHGQWKSPCTEGTYSYSLGPSDDYLELDADRPWVPSAVPSSDDSGKLSIRVYDERRELTALRLVERQDPELESPIEHVRALLTDLLAYLPPLTLELNNRWLTGQAVCPVTGQAIDVSVDKVTSGEALDNASMVASVLSLGLEPDSNIMAVSAPPCPTSAAKVPRSNTVPMADVTSPLPPEPSSQDEPKTTIDAPLTRVAVQLIEDSRIKQARKTAQDACAAGEPEAADLLEAIATILQTARRLQRRPRDAKLQFALAWAYFLANAGQQATSAANKALQMNPGLGEAHALLGLEQSYQGDFRGAAQRHEVARRLAGDRNMFVLALAEQLEKPAAKAQVGALASS